MHVLHPLTKSPASDAVVCRENDNPCHAMPTAPRGVMCDVLGVVRYRADRGGGGTLGVSGWAGRRSRLCFFFKNKEKPSFFFFFEGPPGGGGWGGGGGGEKEGGGGGGGGRLGVSGLAGRRVDRCWW